MQVRHAIAAVSVAAFALTLAACTSDPAPSASAETTAPAPSVTAAPTTAPAESPTPTASPSDVVAGSLREITPGYDLAGTANSLRTGFPSFAEKTDDEIAIILNAGCDAIDLKGQPQAAADAIQTYDIEVYDAAFSVSAAIVLYCPEYTNFLKGA